MKKCNLIANYQQFPHFWKLDNSSVIARQNVKVALAVPVLQYKKKPLWRVEGMNNFFLSVFL